MLNDPPVPDPLVDVRYVEALQRTLANALDRSATLQFEQRRLEGRHGATSPEALAVAERIAALTSAIADLDTKIEYIELQLDPPT